MGGRKRDRGSSVSHQKRGVAIRAPKFSLTMHLHVDFHTVSMQSVLLFSYFASIPVATVTEFVLGPY